MYQLDGLPDQAVHVQCKLETTSPLPVRARRIGIIDLAGLKFYERPDVAGHFALIFSATLAPVSGLVFRALDLRDRAEPTLADDWAVRYDIHRHLTIEIENVSNGSISIPGAILTIAGFPAAVVPHAFTPAATTDEGIASGIVRVKSMAGVILSQAWQTVETIGTLHIVTVTATATIDGSTNIQQVNAAGATTQTLPTTVQNGNGTLTVKSLGTGTATIAAPVGLTIEGGSKTISTQYGSLNFYLDGTVWRLR